MMKKALLAIFLLLVSFPAVALEIDLGNRDWWATKGFDESKLPDFFSPENSIGLRKFPIAASQLFPKQKKNPLGNTLPWEQK